MPSTFFWLEYPEKDRQRAQCVVDSLRKHDTRVELRIGTVRDAMSNLTATWAMTIQNRPKFFFRPRCVQADSRERALQMGVS